MFLPSCEILATREPTLATLLGRLDQALAQMGPAGEIDPAELAYILEEEIDRIDAVLCELVQLGGLVRQDRVFCPNGCSALTMEEFAEATAEGAPPCCSECDERLEPSSTTVRTMYLISKASDSPTGRANRPTDGRALLSGRIYKMLFVAANPNMTTPVAIDAEWRRLKDRFSQIKCRVEIERIDRWAATTHDLRRAILDENPTLVHFSGHGRFQGGLCFADDVGQAHHVSGKALAELFKLFKCVECILLNACHSAELAEAISPHVHCVIGMQGEIGDESAVEFSSGFYDALTAGEPYGRCFDVAVNALDLANLTDVDRPRLWLDGIRYPGS